ncbi:hypothetical protein U1Q18_045215 [Sarracenia purpurea var. burkii]
METEGTLSFSVASVVEDVLQQHGTRSRDLDLESRRAEEAATRRYEAAGWLRKMVGVVGAKDLPAEPSEEEFRLGLRSGLILCNALNKVQPGAVPKIVESPRDSALIPDGAALSAYQYFENVRNFLVVVQEIGLPTFEASDMEQGGKSARVVNCVLALKSYSDWKQTGGNGVWKFGGNLKHATSGKQIMQKHSDPFISSFSRNLSMSEKSLNAISPDLDSNNKSNSSLSMLVRAVLLDKKPEEVSTLVESMLGRVVEEFEHRITNQTELGNKSVLKQGSRDIEIEEKNTKQVRKEECFHKNYVTAEESERRMLKQRMIFEQQNREIMELKRTLQATKAGMQFIQKKFHDEIHNLGRNLVDLWSNYLSSVDHIEEGTITINTPSMHGKGHRSFNFNKVFGPSATQDTQPLIRSVLDGYNVCIFAYGQTGSGKTYTMVGPKDITEQNRGVNYRALSDLFLLAEQRKNTFRYDVYVQMIEIYNEQVRDLLVVDGLNVPDASIVQVTSTFDVIELMNLGQRNRAVGATALNDRSSRSHSRGCMHLVDLAGSERVDKSEVIGDRLKEAQHINKSLSALGDVISSLAQKNSHVPYRNSKLTQLLQDSLGKLNEGILAKTLMFVHISPEAEATGETISTLKFAERVATIELGVAQVNKDSAYVRELKEQIASLKVALARKEGNLEVMQKKVSGSPRCAISSPHRLSPRNGDLLANQKSYRKLLEDAGNKEQKVSGSQRGIVSSPLHLSPRNKDLLANQKSYRKLLGDAGNIESTITLDKEGNLEGMQQKVSGSQRGIVSSPRHLSPRNKDLLANQKSCRKLLGDAGNIESTITLDKEGNLEGMQQKVSGSQRGIVSSPRHLSPGNKDLLSNQKSCRKLLGDAGNIENNSALRQKRQNLDLDELLGNSPSWPPASSPVGRNFRQEDKETGSDEWVDKVMVNRQNVVHGVHYPSVHWEADNGPMSDVFYQKYLSDSSKTYSEPSYSIFAGSNQFETATIDGLYDLDAYTSDSSEPDLVWQFSHAKLTNLTNEIGLKVRKHNPKPSKGSEQSRNMISRLASQSQMKLSAGTGPASQRSGRQAAISTVAKRKTGNRK